MLVAVISERTLNKHFMIVQYIELVVRYMELIATTANKMLRILDNDTLQKSSFDCFKVTVTFLLTFA